MSCTFHGRTITIRPFSCSPGEHFLYNFRPFQCPLWGLLPSAAWFSLPSSLRFLHLAAISVVTRFDTSLVSLDPCSSHSAAVRFTRYTVKHRDLWYLARIRLCCGPIQLDCSKLCEVHILRRLLKTRLRRVRSPSRSCWAEKKYKESHFHSFIFRVNH